MYVVSELELGNVSDSFFSISQNEASAYFYAIEVYPNSNPTKRTYGIRLEVGLKNKVSQRTESFVSYIDFDEIKPLIEAVSVALKFDGKSPIFPAVRTTMTLRNGMQLGVFKIAGNKKFRFHITHEKVSITRAELDGTNFLYYLEEGYQTLEKAKSTAQK